jgi:hypothetical protein
MSEFFFYGRGVMIHEDGQVYAERGLPITCSLNAFQIDHKDESGTPSGLATNS